MSTHKSQSSSSLSSSASKDDDESPDNQHDGTYEGTWVTPFIGSYHQYLNSAAKSSQEASRPTTEQASPSSTAHDQKLNPRSNLASADSNRFERNRKSSTDAMMLPAITCMSPPSQDNGPRAYFHRGIGGRGNYHKVVHSAPAPVTTKNNNVASKPYPKTIPKTNGSLGKSLRALVRSDRGHDYSSNSVSDDSIGEYKERIATESVEEIIAMGGAGGAGVISVQKGLPPSKQPLPYGAADKIRRKLFGR